MATANTATRNDIEQIKSDLQSIATCTSVTVTALQGLLSDVPEAVAQKENTRVRNSKSISVQSNARRKATSKTTITVEVVEKDSATLTPKEKYILATDFANATLKTLADALKNPPVSQHRKPSSKPKTTGSTEDQCNITSKSRIALSRTPSCSQRPLQERSVSQVINSPKKPSSLCRSSSYSSCITTGPAPGLIATGECARVAFAYLRTSEASKMAGKDSPKLQLENGILALVGKLIAHGLDALAIKELKILKKRLDDALGNTRVNQESQPGKGNVAPKKTATPGEKENLAALLDFADIDLKSPALPIIISHQIYVLRMIAVTKRPRIIEAAWNYLKLSNPSSPANLILQYAKTPNAQVKATRQLESLAQTVLSLCPSISSSADLSPGKDNLNPPPDVVFYLQHLAFRIRQRWWALANHQGNKERELFDPFAKCLAAFSRRSAIPAVKKYRLAEALYKDIFNATDKSTSQQNDAPSVKLAAKTLSSLAQAAALTDEAVFWAKASQPPDFSKDNAARVACHLARIAALSLDAALGGKPGSNLEENIANSLDALAGSLGGSSTDLDSLFMEVNGLRRLATKGLSFDQSTDRSGGGEFTGNLKAQALRIISASVHFAARYIGTKPLEDAGAKTQIRHGERVIMVARVLKSIIDSVTVCAKQSIESDAQWTQLDALIQDCVSMLQLVQEHADKEDRSILKFYEELQFPFIKVSNTYWTAYLQLRRGDGAPASLIKAMQRSVDLLRSRSKVERQSGLLAMKLEKLGEALASVDQVDESRTAFTQSLQNLADAGVLQTAVELAAKYPIQRIFDSDGPISNLGRVMKSNHNSFIKHGISKPTDLAFFDDEDLPAADRGVLLEWQLAFYLRSLSKNRPWDPALNASVQMMSKRLLELYAPTEFPIRRKRVCVLLLQLCEEHPDLLTQSLLQLIGEAQPEVHQESTRDKNLSQYGNHLRVLLTLKLAMRETSPSMTILKECLSVWQSIVDSAHSRTTLTDQVDDLDHWIRELQGIADYLAAKGEEYMCISVLRLLVKILELENGHPSLLVISLCKLGLQLLRLGYSGKAGLAFVKAEALASSPSISTEAVLQWHLGYAEYLLKIGNSVKCANILSAAETIAVADAEFMGLGRSSATSSGRVCFNRLLADACYVYSLHALNTGCHKAALEYAKRCVALNRRAWAALENRSSSRRALQTEDRETEAEAQGKVTFDPLSSARNEKGMPVVMSITHESLNGARFWPLVPSLHRGIMLHSLAFAHRGLLQEAVFAAEQADKVASATHSNSLLLESSTHRAEYWAQSGRPDKAQAVLDSIGQSLLDKHLSMVRYYSSVARTHHSSRRFDEELAAYERLEGLLNDLTSPFFIKTTNSVPYNVETLVQQMPVVSLDGSKSKGKKTTKGTRGRKPTVKTPPTAARKAVQPKETESSSVVEECAALYSLQADVARRKALVNIAQENISKAVELLDEAQKLEKGMEHSILHLWVSFKALLSQSMKELANDFTFNTLPESTIAFPALGQTDRKLSEGSVAKHLQPQRTAPAPSAPLKSSRGKKAAKEDFVATLYQARNCIAEAHALCSRSGSNSSFQQASCALGYVTVLLSAASNGDLRGSLHPLYAAYMNELPKLYSLRLAQAAIEVEQETKSREEYLKWPVLASRDEPSLVSATQFQKDYVDILPESWAAISLALNDDHDELYVTRYQSNYSPFVLRLPMARHKSRDMDEEEFGFDDGRRDFDEIIELSDFSTRSAKDMTAKEARAQWWTEREALDSRLHELLLNIENIWLGGFKGIFSQHPRQPNLLARFRKSFENILNRHLPSRRGKGPPKKIALDPRILELFVGLGDAMNEELDLDEALMDLVYFVVDILQFNGERNAYDEIDFDAIVIETLDALRAYHGAAQTASADSKHTILILDKNLHIFPWESLPCLQSLSISRLPSLAALRERILAARSPAVAQVVQPGHYISANAGGTSILNPSGDLTHTLKTIKPRLDEMVGNWTLIINRAPSETEFENSLKERELVLYFGHGSGAQFVRSKSVRRLYPGDQTGDEKKPGCATTFLFGCSSVHLSENGIYEPSGMLASYLTAGAPAVVGMLWDVTDKDCDRFAVKAGELWGLWPESKEDREPRTAKKPKGKGKVAQLIAEVESARRATSGRKGRKVKPEEDAVDLVGSHEKERRRGVGLDEAVREARDACVLRYLNGAAAVVYGIPVYLN
ncbi:hypothetical protein K469DRAFT_745861 [Zopfia rhizophila CBS 207.26]|uniref:separase n=1 Tax=Zopfia rhizophila CBS 207.26 TaxID=1314779 RepID=A0A6A6ENR9_9PEZI|nr:hypothetical protein K469DRAFT_745861 [Zopfia rhizophila CBS 207.26]